MTQTATYRQLHRSRSDRMLAGVCGGLGDYFNVNPVFYRVGFVILTLLGGAGLLVYGACILVIPIEGERESIASDVIRNHRQRPVALAGLILVAAAGIALLSHVNLHWHGDTFWVIALLAGVVILWTQRRPATVPPPATEAATAVVPTPRRPRRRPFLVFFAVIGFIALACIVAVAIVGSFYAHLGHGIGTRNYAPANQNTLRSSYRIGIGDLTVDLSGLTLQHPTTVHAEAGIGHVHVVVPRGVTVRVKSHVSWGQAQLLGHKENGHDVRADVGSNDAQLVIDTDVGIGDVDVDRANP